MARALAKNAAADNFFDVNAPLSVLQQTADTRVGAAQIPELAQDVAVPPWCEPGGPCNAWIGTAGAATPLHFDGYDNLLAQVCDFRLRRETCACTLLESKRSALHKRKSCMGGALLACMPVCLLPEERVLHVKRNQQ